METEIPEIHEARGEAPRRPPLRANTAPLPLLALDPAHRPHTIHNANIFFMNSRSHMQGQHTPLYPNQQPTHTPHPLLSRYATEPPPPPPFEFLSSSRPELRRSSTTPPPPPPPPPPLPPKPIGYSLNPQSLPLPLPPVPVHAQTLAPLPPLPPTPDPGLHPGSNVPRPEEPLTLLREDDDLAFALALSQSESAKQLVEQQRLASQEEEDLARALAESMKSTDVNYSPHRDSSGERSNNFASTSKLSLKTSYEHLSSNSSLRYIEEDSDSNDLCVTETPTSASLPKELDIPRSQNRWDAPRSRDRTLSMDRAVTRPMVDSMMPGRHTDEKETLAWDVNDDASLDLPEYTPRIDLPSQIPPPTSSPQAHRGMNGAYTRQREVDDEAFARQLAAQQDEEDNMSFSHSTLQAEAISYPNLTPPQGSLSRNQQQSLAFNYPRASLGNARQDQASNAPVNVHVSLSLTNQIMYPTPFSSSSFANQPDVPTLLVEPPLNISRRNSFGPPDTPNLVYSHSLPTGSSVSLDTSQASISRADLDRSSSNASSRSGPTGLGASMTPSPNPSVINVNHFIDTEQLLGVSIGFVPPPLTEQLLPMQDSMPNIVSLPYGRCPPLHFQGQSWRHLLRLMARLSGSRIEPTVEAVAVSKSELQLRTVVQFIKPTPASREWRTILWFALEHPVPPTMSGAHRYMGNNVNVLPWSFMMTPVPKLLLDGVDSAVSKTFSIPPSDAVPYPKLPITFPNLAMYLQAALDESRRHLNDNSTQLRKLAKMMQQCYPSTEEGMPDGPEKSSSVGGLFKRVIGRSNKQNKKRGGGNEDTYELVTPFVPDEWGG